MTDETPLTTAELRSAFKRSGLWRLGWTYADAMAKPAVYRALTAAARAAQGAAAKGAVPPRQAWLFARDLTNNG